MGILFSKIKCPHRSKATLFIPPSYSWDNKPENISAKNYIIENMNESQRWKLPGSVNGEQFIIQNCTYSTIFILDFCNTVTIDDCNHCTIIFGPIKRSIFIRDCIDCTIMVACEQFRLRDCKNLKVSLYCATKPIIESSKNISFSCLQLHYDTIQEQFQKCNLNVWNNIWYKIHDYTPANKNDDFNWNFSDGEEALIEPTVNEIFELELSNKKDKSVIPFTTGTVKRISDQFENCLVVFCDDFSARSFLKIINRKEGNLTLIKSRQTILTVAHAESLFLTSTLIKAVQHGPIIGLHMYGKNVIHLCSQIIVKTMETTLYYVSPTNNIASHQVNTFFSIADLQIETFS